MRANLIPAAALPALVRIVGSFEPSHAVIE